MSHELFATLALAAANGKTFHIGPWIVVPLLLLAALIGTPIYILKDRRKRRSDDAIVGYVQAIQLAPQTPDYHCHLAKLLAEAQRHHHP